MPVWSFPGVGVVASGSSFWRFHFVFHHWISKMNFAFRISWSWLTRFRISWPDNQLWPRLTAAFHMRYGSFNLQGTSKVNYTPHDVLHTFLYIMNYWCKFKFCILGTKLTTHAAWLLQTGAEKTQSTLSRMESALDTSRPFSVDNIRSSSAAISPTFAIAHGPKASHQISSFAATGIWIL